MRSGIVGALGSAPGKSRTREAAGLGKGNTPEFAGVTTPVVLAGKSGVTSRTLSLGSGLTTSWIIDTSGNLNPAGTVSIGNTIAVNMIGATTFNGVTFNATYVTSNNLTGDYITSTTWFYGADANLSGMLTATEVDATYLVAYQCLFLGSAFGTDYFGVENFGGWSSSTILHTTGGFAVKASTLDSVAVVNAISDYMGPAYGMPFFAASVNSGGILDTVFTVWSDGGLMTRSGIEFTNPDAGLIFHSAMGGGGKHGSVQLYCGYAQVVAPNLTSASKVFVTRTGHASMSSYDGHISAVADYMMGTITFTSTHASDDSTISYFTVDIIP